MFIFKAEENLVMIYQTHISHQENLLFYLLLPCLEEQNKPNEIDFNEINTVMINWGKQELYNYGYISTYHLWEKQIGHIIKDQSKGKIKIPGGNFVTSIRNILRKEFNIDSINEETWRSLDIARIVVNAFKHGEGKSLEDLKSVLPEVIFEGDSDLHHSIIEIQEKHLRDLFNTLNGFYEFLQNETKLDFSNW